jgi:hypothetical protein
MPVDQIQKIMKILCRTFTARCKKRKSRPLELLMDAKTNIPIGKIQAQEKEKV